jgi:periplasmic protein TonB
MVTQILPPAVHASAESRKLKGIEPSNQAAQNKFVTAMLDVPQFRRRNPLQLAVSLAVHILVISALVIAPLMFTDSLDLRSLQSTWLVAPAPPPPPPPPLAPAVRRLAVSPRIIPLNQLMAPRVIPKKIEIVRESPLAPDAGVVGGVEGGIPGGQAGGVLGGIIGRSNDIATVTLPPPPAVPKIVRVGGKIKPPMQIYAPPPTYPAVAKAARIQGTVLIDAIIDEQGNVVRAHVISGPGLLVPAALEAVGTWKYEPTRLDGEPVSVEMHVAVNFVMQ